MCAKRYQSRSIDGVLVVDKPSGPSSNRVLQQLRHLYQANKAGHGGTLDPLASGALLVCFGRATKLLRFLLAADKFYRVEAQLGSGTDTGDAAGDIVATYDMSPSEDEIISALAVFRGQLKQVPPMYSALKHKGRPLYQLAREGQTIVREPRAITIYDNIFHDYDAQCQRLSFSVRCSKGTYIRTLVEDIGSHLGGGAHVALLRRLSAAPFEHTDMHKLSDLLACGERDGLSGLDACLLSAECMVADLPVIILPMRVLLEVRHGRGVPGGIEGPLGWVRVVSERGELIAVGLLGQGFRPLSSMIWLRDLLASS